MEKIRAKDAKILPGMGGDLSIECPHYPTDGCLWEHDVYGAPLALGEAEAIVKEHIKKAHS